MIFYNLYDKQGQEFLALSLHATQQILCVLSGRILSPRHLMRRKLDSGVRTNVQFECTKTEVPGSVVHEGARGNAFESKKKGKKCELLL